MIISQIKSKFLIKQFQKEYMYMRWVLFNVVTLEISTPVNSNSVSKLH